MKIAYAFMFAMTIGGFANAAIMPSDMNSACYSGKIERVKPWIDKDASLVNAGGYGVTCLIVAADKNFTDLGLYLLKAGADVNMYGSDVALPALFLATARKNYVLLDAMLKHGGNPWLVNGNYAPAYAWKIFIDNDDVRALQVYLNNGWNPAEQLERADPLSYAASANALNVAKELIKNKFPVNRKSTFRGESFVSSYPLGMAIKNRNSEMAILLLQAGANPNSVSQFSFTYAPRYYAATMLGAAAQEGLIDVTRALITAGAFVNIPAKTQDIYYYLESPLCSAAAGVNWGTEVLATMKILLDAQANIEICRFPWNQDIQYIPTPLYRAISTSDDSNFEKVKLLVNSGANVNATWDVSDDFQNKVWTPLSYAIAKNMNSVADFLRQHGAR